MANKELRLKRTALIISAALVLSVFVSVLFILSKTNFSAHAISEIKQTIEESTLVEQLGEFKRLGVVANNEPTEEFYIETTTEKKVTETSTQAETSTKKAVETSSEASEEKDVTYTVRMNDYTLELINEVVRLTNIERAKYGLPALSLDMNSEVAAMKRAIESSQSFSHTRPNGSNWSSVLREFNINDKDIAGENLAMGQTSAEELVADWMASETHRANILSKSFSEISIGIYEEDGVLYWSQLFAG